MTELYKTGNYQKQQIGIRLLVLLFLLVCAKPAWSQPCSSAKPNVNMCFYIDGNPQNATQIRICAGTKVKIIDCSTNGDLIQYSFVGDSFKLTPKDANGDYTYTYTTPGLYTILQQGNYPDPPPGMTIGLYRYYKCNYIEVLPNIAPTFTLKYCANRQVSIQITDNTYTNYLINWGDGSPNETVSATGSHVHAYTNVDPRTITVSGQYAGTIPPCGGSQQQTVTPVVDLPVPRLRKLTIENPSRAELQFEAAANTAYRIEKKESNGTYSTISTIPEGSTRVVSQVLTGNFGSTSITYRVVALDVCGSSVVPSEEISSIVFNAIAANAENQLNWQANPVATFVSGELTSTRGLTKPIAVQSGMDVDANVKCGDVYCYQMRQTLTGGAVSVSDTFCLKAISTLAPAAVQGLVATVKYGSVVLTWKKPVDAQEFTILRIGTNGQASLLSRTTDLEYTDADSRLEEQSRCYQLIYTDKCGNVSEPSPIICPIRLQQVEDPTQQGYGLVWAPYTGWNGTTPIYRIEKLNAQNLLLDVQLANQEELFFPMDTLNQLIRFRITAEDGTQISISNVIEIRQKVQLGVPEAFSPNGDGINDQLFVRGLFINTFRFVIYNRWGEIVYASGDMTRGWDGRNNHSTTMQNVYTYAITVEDQLGKKTVKLGSVLVLRQ